MPGRPESEPPPEGWRDHLVALLRPSTIRGSGRLRLLLSPGHGHRRLALAPEAVIDLDLADELQRLMWCGLLHPDLLPWLDRLLPVGGTFLDVGANIGFFTVHGAHRVGPAGRVAAFEPVPRTADRLAANVARNRFTQVEVVRAAVGARCGAMDLLVPPEGLHADYLAGNALVQGSQAVSVPVTTLDAWFDAHPGVVADLMKIDIEGAEVDALAGAAGALAAGRIRAVVMEVNGPSLAARGLRPEDQLAPLLARGFRLVHPAPLARSDRPLDPTRDYNLVLVNQPPPPGADHHP